MSTCSHEILVDRIVNLHVQAAIQLAEWIPQNAPYLLNLSPAACPSRQPHLRSSFTLLFLYRNSVAPLKPFFSVALWKREVFEACRCLIVYKVFY